MGLADGPEWEPYIDVPGKGDPAPITALEQSVGIVLPPAIRQVLLDHAGDAPLPDSIRVGRRSATSVGPILFAGGQKGEARFTYSIEFVLASLTEWSRGLVPGEWPLFPFCTNTASGYFCLDYRDDPVRPPIVFVDFDYDVDEAPAILPVAADWQEMVARLT